MGVTAIGDDKVTEADLKAVDTASDEECLTYETTTGDFEWQSCAGSSMTSFTAAGDAGGGQSITNTDTLSILGGTNGIDTVDSATDTVTINLDTTEVGTTTFGAGAAVTWTFDTSAGTDTTIAFGDNTQTFSAGTHIFTGYLDAPGATLSASVAGNVPLTVKAAGSQTANLTTWTNSSGTVLSGVDLQGRLFSYGGSGITSNLFFGSAGKSTATGIQNTAIGEMALDALTDGHDNLAIGRGSLTDLTTGDNNIALSALGNVVGGTGNVGLGFGAGNTVVSGNYNILIGYYAGDNQTGSSRLVVDSTNRASISEEEANAILYGTMAAAAINQTLAINAVTSISDGLIVNEGGLTTADLRVEGDTDANLLFVDASSDNVGIGVADPDTQLEVFHAGNQLKLSFDATDNATFGVDTDGNLTIDASGTKTIIADDLEITGGDLITGNTTSTLFNTVATTLSMGGAASTLNIGPTGSGAGSILLAGGSGDTGCTIDDSNGNLACSGTISGTFTVAADSLDFTEFKDAMALDASTSIAFDAAEILTFDAATVDTTTTGGVLDFNIDAGNAAVIGLNLDFAQSDGATAGIDAIGQKLTLTGNDADGDMFGLVINAAATVNAAAGTYEAGIKIDNAEDTAGSMTDAIVVTATTDTAITDGIDVSDAEIVNAINVGANTLLGTTGLIDYTNFDVDASGHITTQVGYGLDTNAAGELKLGDTTATTISLGTTAATTINLGNSGSLTRTINLGTGTGADTINIGTGIATADDINIGNLATTTIDIKGVMNFGGGTTYYIDASGESTNGDAKFHDLIVADTGLGITVGDSSNAQIKIGDTTLTDNSSTFAIATEANSSLTLNVNSGDAAGEDLIITANNLSLTAAGAMSFTPDTAVIAIDATDTDITTALSVGANDIVGTTGLINYEDFDIDADGLMTFASDGAGDQITIVSPAADFQALVIDATTADSTSNAGIIDLNWDSSTQGASGISVAATAVADGEQDWLYGVNLTFNIQDDAATTDVVIGQRIDITNSDTNGAGTGIYITANGAGVGPVNSGIVIDNLQATDIDLTTGILIRGTAVDSVTTALDVADDGIVTALNVGANDIVGTTGLINYTNFDVDASGNIEFSAAAKSITLPANGAADDLTISVTGAVNSSLILSSTGTAADALQIITTAGGIDITSTGAAAGEDIDISTNTSINLTASEATANQITLSAEGTYAGTAMLLSTTDGRLVIDANGATWGDLLMYSDDATVITATGALSLTGSTSSLINFPYFDVGSTGAVTIGDGTGGSVTNDITLQYGEYINNNVDGDIRMQGNVTINRAAIGAYALTVGGTACIDTDNNGTCDAAWSDIRLKKDITDYTGGLDLINQLDPVNFTFRYDEFDMGLSHDAQVGLIAQELETIFPQAVQDTDMGYKMIQYEKLVPITISAIQEQQTQINTLSQQINDLALSEAGTLPSLSTPQLATNLISPLVSDQPITIDAPTIIKDQHTTTPDLIVEGEIAADSVSARIAKLDTLEVKEIVADRIIAGSIVGLDAKIATLSAKTTSTLSDSDLTDLTDRIKARLESLVATDSATAVDLPTPPEATDSAVLDTNIYDLTSNISSDSATLLTADINFVTVNNYLAVIGSATITQLSVTDTLLAHSIQAPCDPTNVSDLTSNSSCLSTLALQPLGGTVNLAQDTLIVDSSGQVSVNGNLSVTGTLALHPNNTDPSPLGKLLQIYNEEGVEVGSINASGSANLAELTTKLVTIASPATATASSSLITTTTTSNATAGNAVLVSPNTELTIVSPFVTPNSLVYLTPTGNSDNKVLFVKSKTSCDQSTPSCEASFTVGIDAPASSDIPFNWWIIELASPESTLTPNP
ncbi:MAG: coiled-coil [Microgenomates group bacterium GW2011_GWC1_46_16]|nr:MAG: coiled-coil [Microgenomates group bacterium GW2011_GWC1_46_16]